MNINTYYQLTCNPHELPGAVKLRYREWELLLGLNDDKTLAEAGNHLGLGEEETRRILSKFLEKELIEIAEMNYSEYVKRKQRGSTQSSNAMPAKKSEPKSPTVQAETRHEQPRPVVPVPPLSAVEPGFAPLPLPAVPVSDGNSATAVSVRKLSIKSLTSFIIQQAGGDSNAGQLMVYRVFMRVDTKLLKRNGITSLRFQEDRLVADPELEQALLDSVAIALGVTCPEYVFVTA